ncbi:Regulator_of chromosome condensation 1/beta-lactamase-inhibitor protein II [Hexamita inflata]|uniref:Regulator of chromosome condensation 1/beta-lactamase-inhibitor protein II n=1 Tax=Hexamita inflata TaxID=28002 RepID=A0AA86Q9J2_9EUKA|nr:Regulator of chromosome condensation 1/beta-lactamase-inhibitor protein II [Hexamita inflata]
MMFAIVLNAVSYPNFLYSQGITVSQISNISGIIDAVNCESNSYIIISNKSIMAKGQDYGLFGEQQQLDFIYIHIDGARQLICDDSSFGYLSEQGKIYYRNKAQYNKVIFDLVQDPIPPIQQIVGNKRIFKMALTESGVFYKGECENTRHLCGNLESNTYTQFTQIPFEQSFQVTQISRLEVDYNIFVHIFMKNGDVYSLGLDPNGLLPLDESYQHTVAFHKIIGNGYSRLYTGFNITLSQFSMYYIKNQNLYVYNRNTSIPERLVQSGIIDIINYGYYAQKQNMMILKDESVEFSVQQQLQANSALEIYCVWNIDNTLCGKDTATIKAECYDQSTLKTDNEYCKLYDCVAKQTCESSTCGPNDQVCIALQCIQNKANKFQLNPKCFYNYSQRVFTVPFLNGKDYKFQNNLLIQIQDSPIIPIAPPQANQMNTKVAVAITAGSCVGVFALVLIVLYFTCKNRVGKSKGKVVGRVTKKTMQGLI